MNLQKPGRYVCFEFSCHPSSFVITSLPFSLPIFSMEDIYDHVGVLFPDL